MSTISKKNTRRLLALTLVLLVGAVLAGCADEPEATATPLPPITMVPFHNEAAFDLLYPQSWTYTIVRQGMILFGEPGTVSGVEEGASVVVYRIAPGQGREDLQETFEHYLNNGPLRTGYEQNGEIESGSLGGKASMVATVSKEEFVKTSATQAFVTAAKVDSGAIYIITATSPEASWNANWPAFQVLLKSVKFNE